MIAKRFNASDWIPLVRSLVARIRIPPGTYEDAVQECLLYLHKKSRGGRFLDVKRAVRWALSDWLRGTGSRFIRMPRSLYERGAEQKKVYHLHGMSCENGDDLLEPYLAAYSDPGFKNIDDRDEIGVYLNWVSTNEAFVLRNCVKLGGPLTDDQCARELGLSGSRISQLRDSGLQRIRGALRSLPKSP